MALRDHLRQRRIRQREIARKLGVSDATVSKWLSGKLDVPSSKVLPLAEAAQMEPGDLLRALAAGAPAEAA